MQGTPVLVIPSHHKHFDKFISILPAEMGCNILKLWRIINQSDVKDEGVRLSARWLENWIRLKSLRTGELIKNMLLHQDRQLLASKLIKNHFHTLSEFC